MPPPPEVEILLRDLDLAAGLLSGSGPARVSSARQALVSVQRRLGELLRAHAGAPAFDANWLMVTRNDLSAHLSAASTLDDEGLHGRAAAVLGEAIDTVRVRLTPSRV